MTFRTIALAAVIHSAGATATPSFLKKSHYAQMTPRFLADEAEGDDGVQQNLANYNILYQNCFADSQTISFKLCERGHGCEQNKCDSFGEYVVDFYEFIDAFTELQLGAREYACEMVRENCETDDDGGWDDCYTNAGYDYCLQEDDDAFELQRYLECVAFDEDYYVGPYCHDTEKIYLQFYTDEDCTEVADVTASDLGYDDMPYTRQSGRSIIDNECGRCHEHADQNDQNGGNDEEDEDDIIEQCEELYEDATKCEVEDSGNNDCDYLESLKSAEGSGFRQRDSSSNSWLGWGIAALAVLAVVGIAFFVVSKKKKAAAAAEEASSKKKPFLSKFNKKGTMS
mmetsp:Transcript_19338/g.28620  ORF Transcript_19338/g.28620 Transcript_19338/m.28620 type:complete len:341 (+) Transcript_19338:72-1094(+)|eukprot:CAMPEP_0194210466 /NCGR_PEP_ID=MMETSP0156-20130528/8537_1 /TAXON_ID=33649 /ORGANISM="Thalassionema nitzschioides, Strain L26-B" /LENGTH=340 /DNA_ID=CAMNT_0038937815 /DNA_START=34 /DNA_END=1056 /DNA_ORIENTATION=+